MNLDEDILYAKKCPYCGKKPEYVDSSCIYYGKSYGMIYLCTDCIAYVGVHKGTDKPLGRLANKELREAKKQAHYYFDKLWKKAILQGRKKHEARNSAYKWLSKELSLPEEYTHIGMMDIEYCNKVVSICKRYVK